MRVCQYLQEGSGGQLGGLGELEVNSVVRPPLRPLGRLVVIVGVAAARLLVFARLGLLRLAHNLEGTCTGETHYVAHSRAQPC